MDLLGRLEIYIPAEAEVKNIPLRSLPNSVLRRMGNPLSDSKGPTNLTGSPEVVWICPVTLRRKGQKAVENMSSVLGREFQAAPGRLRMSFVSSNHTAYKVLKEMPGNKVSAQRSPISSLRRDSAPQKRQDAVVIYHGNIYLSIKKPSGSQRKKQTPEPQPSTLSSKSQQKELLNDNRPEKKRTTCEVTRSDNKKGVRHKEEAESTNQNSDMDTNMQITEPGGTGYDYDQLAQEKKIARMKEKLMKVHDHFHKDAEGQQAAEEATTMEPDMDTNMQITEPGGTDYAYDQLAQEEKIARMKEKLRKVDNHFATTLEPDMDTNMQIDSSEANQSSTSGEPLGAARASTSLQMEVDFEQLAKEEKIGKLRAKLRQEEANDHI